MESISTAMKRVEAQKMISRFRSKEDLYRYLTLHVGLFLPAMEGTKISFLKAILCDEKKALKKNQIKLIEIPNYTEISVTNLYEDAMKDEELEVYLPTKKQLSYKLQKGASSLVFLELQERAISERSLKKLTRKTTLFLLKIKSSKSYQYERTSLQSLVSFDTQQCSETQNWYIPNEITSKGSQREKIADKQ